jgi:hypothetical protein
MSKAAYNVACQCQLRPTAKAVLKELAWFANDQGENAWPSVRTLAERTGLGRRAVQKILRESEQVGAIQAVGNRLGGRHRTTRYRLVLAWFQANCAAKKGERGDTERANGSAQKGERGSPEQKEHEYEEKEKQISIKGKEPQATPYEQQRREQQYRKGMREKSFPTPRSKVQPEAQRMKAKRQLAEFEKRYSAGKDKGTADQ